MALKRAADAYHARKRFFVYSGTSIRKLAPRDAAGGTNDGRD
jgi:hypothetical protein